MTTKRMLLGIWVLALFLVGTPLPVFAIGSGVSGVNNSGGPLKQVRLCGLSSGTHMIETYTPSTNQHTGVAPCMYLLKQGMFRIRLWLRLIVRTWPNKTKQHV